MQVARQRASGVTSSQHRIAVIGLLGAILFVAGVGLYLVGANSPYQQDESSHVGYALSLRHGVLPAITTPVPTEGGGDHLAISLKRPWPFSDPDIHVANNPPFTYLVALPFVEGAIRTHVTDGPLIVLRLIDLLGAVVAIGCAYFLGRELGGGDRFVGLVTAGLLAGVIGITIVSAVANVDGPALAATTGVTWMMARFARTRSLRDATLLGLWCAGAAAVRPMSLAFAAVAGALALFLGWRARGRTALLPLALRLAAPTVLLTGWFYAINWHRYGDWTGSKALFEKYGTLSGPSLLTTLHSQSSFVQPFPYLITEVYGRDPWWLYRGPRHYLIAALAVGVVIAAVVLAARSARPAPDRSDRPRLSLAAWACAAVLAAVPILLIAQHISGGGAGHARYLLPTLPIVAAAAALVTSRMNRWLAIGAVAAFAVAQLTRIRAAGDLHRAALSITPPPLRNDVAGRPFLAISVVIALAGAVTLLVALVQMTRDTRPAVADASPPADARGDDDRDRLDALPDRG